MVVVLAVALGVAGCGGGSSSAGVSPSAYAASLCNAVAPFERDIASRASALDPSQIKSATQGKTVLQGFLAAIAQDTKTATSRLKQAGTPEVSDGKAIAGAFVQLFGRLQTTLQTAASSAQSLPTGSPSAFQTAARSLGDSVRSSMSDLGASLSQLKSPELEAAAKKVSACRTLG